MPSFHHFWVIGTGYILAVVMCAVEWLISARREVTHGPTGNMEVENWERTAKFYRNILRWAVFLAIFAGGIAIAILLFDWLQRGVIVPDVAAVLDPRAGPASILLVAFFTGALRLIFDRATGDAPWKEFKAFISELGRSFFQNEKLRNEPVKISAIESSGRGNPRAWILWFAVTLVFSMIGICYDVLKPSSESTASVHDSDLVSLLKSIAVILCGLGGALSWIYVGLYCKMTMSHQFSSRATRLFLGGLFQSTVPRQIVVIGPPGHGKTAYTCANLIPPDGNRFRTRNITARTFKFDPVVSDAVVTAIDTPGENLGDHLMTAAHFRTDVLVLILHVGQLNPSEFGKLDSYQELSYYNLGLTGAVPGQGISTRDYLRALELATRFDKAGPPRKEVYGVRRFVLYFNTMPGEENLSGTIFTTGKPQDLARHIGKRFGVDDPRACCAMWGNATSSGNGRERIFEAPPG